MPRTEVTKQKDKALETKVLQTADMVTVISPGMKKEFESRARKIEVVSNGYDEEDFSMSEVRSPKSEEFVIRYVGNLMSSQNLEVLWKCISELSASDIGHRTSVKLEFIGRVDDAVKKSISENGLDSIVHYLDFVDHRKAIQLMQEASMLLFAIPDVKDNEVILTGKLFEYLASTSEMISFGPVNGNATEILTATGRKK